MKTVTAIFESALKADRARFQLRVLGLKRKQITLLTPASSPAEVHATPTADGEQPGMGKAIGALVGAAAGLWISALLAVLQLSFYGGWRYLVVCCAGALIGSAMGGLAGAALENLLTKGLPRDELYFYQNELKYGRSVIVVRVDRKCDLGASRRLLEDSGAQTLNAARKARWIGLRATKPKLQHRAP